MIVALDHEAIARVYYAGRMALQDHLYVHVARRHFARPGAGALGANDCGCAYCESLCSLIEAAWAHFETHYRHASC